MMKALFATILTAGFSLGAFADVSVNVDWNAGKGPIKEVNSVGQPPVMGWVGTNMFHHLRKIGAKYSRLHDVGGPYGGGRFVDIPNVFPDFDADETDPKNYRFQFTDKLLEGLVAAGCEPFYRLGVSIENNAHIERRHIMPPKDFAKWARICEHIIRHYTEGWADGFHYDIEYWEIWNEPDDGLRISQMWNGTAEDYYRLYDVAAKHLKKCFPNIKIGGYAAIGFYAAVET
jgi:hypothetical protein